MEELPPVSDSVLNDMIGVWRHARLSGGHIRGWPAASLLGRLVDMGAQALAALRGRIGVPPEWGDEDRTPYIIQAIVEQMPYEMRSVFEAHELALVRGDSCRGRPHKYRATLLAISEATYYRRWEAGRAFVRQGLDARYVKSPNGAEKTYP